MSWMQKAKGLIWEEPQGGSETVAPQPQPAAQPQALQTAQRASTKPEFAVVTAEMVQHILEEVLVQDTAFTKLYRSAKALEPVIPDEQMRIRAAVTMAGGSVEQVLSSLSAHLGSIDLSVQRFSQSAESKKVKEMESLKGRLSKITSDLSSAQAEIARCEARIAELKTTTADLQREGSEVNASISTRAVEIQETVTSFTSAGATAKIELEKFRSSITTFVSTRK